jgi:hypothetical protein
MHVVDLVIFVGWLAFWIYWLAAAVGVKSGHTGWTRFAGFRVGIILVVLLLVRARVFKGHSVISDPWLQGIGLAVFVLGLHPQRDCGGTFHGQPLPGVLSGVQALDQDAAPLRLLSVRGNQLPGWPSSSGDGQSPGSSASRRR